MRTKMVIVMRKDLNMRKGKMVVQGGHSILGNVLKKMFNFKIFKIKLKILVIKNDSALDSWLSNSFVKICVGCDSEEELISLKEKAKAKKIPYMLIQDNGTTEFNNVPTYTCMALGPDRASKIDEITGHLKLL